MDVYNDAISSVDVNAVTNLTTLLTELQANYQADDTGALFP
jgi:hypothetical protein